ncbi:solute carrier family 12 member 5 [Arapaima gigas]
MSQRFTVTSFSKEEGAQGEVNQLFECDESPPRSPQPQEGLTASAPPAPYAQVLSQPDDEGDGDEAVNCDLLDWFSVD